MLQILRKYDSFIKKWANLHKNIERMGKFCYTYKQVYFMRIGKYSERGNYGRKVTGDNG